MKKLTIYILALVFVGPLFTGCNSKSTGPLEVGQADSIKENTTNAGIAKLQLSKLKFESLGIKVDTMPIRTLVGFVEANGQLEVPPQHEATVTAVLGANVTSIKVIEGDKVEKGQVLAYISHPNLTNLQTGYVKAYSRLQYLEKEMQRQKRLYEEEVGSGKVYQKTLADYMMIMGEVKGYEAQLKQLSLNVKRVQIGDIYQYIPVVSPINGYIEKVKVQIGQFVEPQTKMFMIVNTEHIHADLMVFEKDVHKVKAGQKIAFSVESIPGETLTAKIYSVGKKFEQNPKALHVHAEIDHKENYLIPGMYINGKINTSNNEVLALPEEAIVEEEGKTYIFMVGAKIGNGKPFWLFEAIEIRKGISNDGWVEIKLLEPLSGGTQVAWNNAYYLMSEMKKSQASHGH